MGAAAFFLTFVFAAAAAAFAAPADDINGVIKAFAAVRSVHVDLTSPEGSGTEDMVNPNKSKINVSFMGREIQVVKIGQDRWTNANGQWRKSRSKRANPIDSEIDMANSLVLEQKDIREAYTVTDGGAATIGIVPVHKYHLVDKSNPAKTGDAFIGPGQLPLKIVINSMGGGMTFTYSNYNGVADISAPM
jgi:hypothetical protein